MSVSPRALVEKKGKSGPMASIETANVGKAVAARVGSNIREVRTKLSLTQAQLAAPEFSISYISAIERGKIRPSLKALSILAKRLDVPLTFLLEGSPAGAAEARSWLFPTHSRSDREGRRNYIQINFTRSCKNIRYFPFIHSLIRSQKNLQPIENPLRLQMQYSILGAGKNR